MMIKMSKYIAIIHCENCLKELARIEAEDPPTNEPDVFVPQMAEMMKGYKIPNLFCQDCRDRR